MSETGQPIYVVITEDRHYDVDVQLYRDRDAATHAAESIAEERASRSTGVVVQEITPAMTDDRWIYFAVYSTEDDCVRVVERELA